jgi:PmbA protein
VLFESPLAAGLLGGFVQAVSGGALYRKSTFLLDSLGKQVFPKHIDITEDPFVVRGKGSSPFDDEGVRVQARKVVDAGRVEGYFLSSYSARKLGMKTTGNAGGSHNLVLTLAPDAPGRRPGRHAAKAGHRPVRDRADGPGRELRDRRLFTRRQRLLGGERPIAYPVQEITIAGNLKRHVQGH